MKVIEKTEHNQVITRNPGDPPSSPDAKPNGTGLLWRALAPLSGQSTQLFDAFQLPAYVGRYDDDAVTKLTVLYSRNAHPVASQITYLLQQLSVFLGSTNTQFNALPSGALSADNSRIIYSLFEAMAQAIQKSAAQMRTLNTNAREQAIYSNAVLYFCQAINHRLMSLRNTSNPIAVLYDTQINPLKTLLETQKTPSMKM